MDIEKKNEIEAKLRQLLESSLKDRSKGSDAGHQYPACNVIRRRKGQADKRIYVAMTG
jgi:hypothetical protein